MDKIDWKWNDLNQKHRLIELESLRDSSDNCNNIWFVNSMPFLTKLQFLNYFYSLRVQYEHFTRLITS